MNSNATILVQAQRNNVWPPTATTYEYDRTAGVITASDKSVPPLHVHTVIVQPQPLLQHHVIEVAPQPLAQHPSPAKIQQHPQPTPAPFVHRHARFITFTTWCWLIASAGVGVFDTVTDYIYIKAVRAAECHSIWVIYLVSMCSVTLFTFILSFGSVARFANPFYKLFNLLGLWCCSNYRSTYDFAAHLKEIMETASYTKWVVYETLTEDILQLMVTMSMLKLTHAREEQADDITILKIVVLCCNIVFRLVNSCSILTKKWAQHSGFCGCILALWRSVLLLLIFVFVLAAVLLVTLVTPNISGCSID
eukprot:TRINITY_DN5044_c0_g1_i1.p1 TRINITY_DN5044_c0_g1~~TRINITY_DN5044_c0_g1_i1.p1  ORF type:complete len:307 (-),score=16.17 TRINITY_DN5044_c0_g1_i1:152-1072(-)